MRGAELQARFTQLLTTPNPYIYQRAILDNPFLRSGARPNSVYVGDTSFGDNGKGVTTADFNEMLVKRFGVVVSVRFNGGSNAGHHMWIGDQEFLTNQLPAAVAQRGAVALVTRGTVLNPLDAVMEIDRTKQTFGGEMPGTLLLDERIPLCLDTHRAMDVAKGSTGRGIGPAYADFYLRQEVTLKDLMSDQWGKVVGRHYDEKRKIIEATQANLLREKRYRGARDMLIKRLDNSQTPLGDRLTFMDRLAEDRRELRPFVTHDMHRILRDNWADSDIPFTFEEGQGPGLDPYAGIRPDVTSSRPSSRNVHDGTWNVIFGEDIALRVGVVKLDHMSSVGSRWLPGAMSFQDAAYYQDEWGEIGKTTRRKRGIYHLNLPIIRALRRFANYDYLVAGFLDSVRPDVPIQVVTHHTDKQSGQELDYLPYQDHIDRMEAHLLELPSWDGQEAAKARTPDELPLNARLALACISEVVAPVIMARNGKHRGDNVRWWKD